MLSISNGLSFLRAPLAFAFLSESTTLRVIAIILAMISDSIDGSVARRRSTVSRFGAILDPAMDKFFVYFALTVFFLEGRIGPWESCAMIARDIFLCIFAVYLTVVGLWKTYEFKAIRWGKASTAFQFLFLIGLAIGYTFQSYFYTAFVVLGILAFIELCQFKSASTNS
jgi:CDP-diacylglycerol--glycerol-3-phosphate 3-phosphatidyltransferase